MKVGINLLLWTPSPTVKDIPLIHKIHDFGYEGAEFEVTLMTEEECRILGNEAKGLDMNVSCISVLPPDADPASPDKAQRDKAVDILKSNIYKAKVAGSEVLGGPITEGLGGPMNSGPKEEEYDRIAEVLARAGEYAKTLDMKLACEVINRFELHMANTVDQMLSITNRTGMDNIGLHVDTHHGNIEEYDICDAWKRAADKIYLVHLSENNRGIPGRGSAIRPEIFETLKEMNYQGPISVEAFFLNRDDFMASRMRIWRKYAESEDEIALEGIKYIKQYI